MKLLLLLYLFSGGSKAEKDSLLNHFSLLGASEKHVREVQKLSRGSADPVYQAYYYAAEMASANYVFNPVSKLSLFNKGKDKLESLVRSYPDHFEIRFIRYAVQLKAPSFLGYNKHLQSDREFILDQLPSIKASDHRLYVQTLSFMLLHAQLSQQEKKSLSL
jgi:hypothetical protein